MSVLQSSPRRLAWLLLAVLPLVLLVAPVGAQSRASAPVAGVDYHEIANGAPLDTLPGRIEVVEVFGYTCNHCANFEPRLAAWRAMLPGDVQFTPVAASFGGYWIPYAKAYYAARLLDVAEPSHAAMFRAVHEEMSMPVSRPTAQHFASFYAGHGADPKKFVSAMESDAVAAELQRTRAFVMRSEVEGTPMMVVNGRYRVPGGAPNSLDTVDYLVERERARSVKGR